MIQMGWLLRPADACYSAKTLSRYPRCCLAPHDVKSSLRLSLLLLNRSLSQELNNVMRKETTAKEVLKLYQQAVA